MSWRGYAKAFLVSNLMVGALVWMLFMTQAWLPLNPDGIANMRWDLALHTMVSFLTNTNQQHYSGQAQLSYLSQMAGIVGLQVVTPMMGLALVVAMLPLCLLWSLLLTWQGVPSTLAGRVVTQPQLLRELWSPTHLHDSHCLRILVGKLRQKLGDDATKPRYIATEAGVGLRFLSAE